MSVPADQMGPTEYTPDELNAFLTGQPAPSSSPTEYAPDELQAFVGQPAPAQPSLLDKAGSAIKSKLPEDGSFLSKVASEIAGSPLMPGYTARTERALAKHPGAFAGSAYHRAIADVADLEKQGLDIGPEVLKGVAKLDQGDYNIANETPAQTKARQQATQDFLKEQNEYEGNVKDIFGGEQEYQNSLVANLAKQHPNSAQAGAGVADIAKTLGLIFLTKGEGEVPEAEQTLANVTDVSPTVTRKVVNHIADIAKESPKGMKAMVLPSVSEGADTFDEVKAKGGTTPEALKAAVAVSSVSDVLSSFAFGMRGPLARRTLEAFLYGTLATKAQTAATNPFLPKDMRENPNLLSMGINGTLQAVIAGIFGKGGPTDASLKADYLKLQQAAGNGDATAKRMLDHINQFAHASGGLSAQAMDAGATAEQARQTVMDADHETLHANNDRYRSAYESAQGQFDSEEKRQQYAKGVAAADTAMNTGWKRFLQLRRLTDSALEDYKAAGQVPDLMGHAKNTLPPEVFADLQDFLTTGQSPQEPSDVPSWLQTGASPQYARDTILRTLEGGKLPPEVRSVVTGRRVRQQQVQALLDAEKAAQEAKPQTGSEPQQPTESAQTQQKSPQDLLENYFQKNPYARSPQVLGYAAGLPPTIQQQMADWAVTRSPLEVEAAYRDAATTGQLPAEVAIHETEKPTESAEVQAEQDQARTGTAQPETQPEAQESVTGRTGSEPAGNEGRAVGQNQPIAGNAAAAEGNAEAAQPVSLRAEPVQVALAGAGVPQDEVSVSPKGDVRIAPDASPEAAQKALDIAAADTGATNTEFPEPTPEQAKAGNYRKGGVTFKSDEGDLRVKIENPDGSVRSGEWGSRPLKGVHYGYFPDTVSADGAPLDVLMTHDAHDPTRPIAFIRQHDTTTGKFDELKVVMGARSRNEALQAYWRQYPRDLHLKLTPDGAQDVVMMKRPKALEFIRSGAVDVPPHPVSGKPMLMLRQMVPLGIDGRTADWSAVQAALDKLGQKHNLTGLAQDGRTYSGEVPRSAVPDLQRALEKAHAEVTIHEPAARQPKVGGRVRANPRSSDTERVRGVRPQRGRRAQAHPAKRSPPPEGFPFVKSNAPVFEEGLNGHIGPHPVSVVGIHYSPKEGLTELDPREAGTGSAGAERRRLGTGNFGRTGGPMNRMVHFYTKDSAAIPAKERVVAGSHRYEAVLNNLYDVKADPDGIVAAEEAKPVFNHDAVMEAIRDNGYDGFVSAFPQAGQHARVATVIGVEGKIPVKELLAAQYHEPAPQRFAGEVSRTRDKFEEAAKEAKNEAKKRKNALFMLHKADQDRLAHIYFEYAPSPHFMSTYARFGRLKPGTQKEISDIINGHMGPDVVDAFGKHQPTVAGWGGYKGKISPSFSMEYDAPIQDVLKHAQDVADAYNQESALVVSDDLPNKAPAVNIMFEGADDPKVLDKFWQQLREKTGDQVVGFSQIDGGIRILNTDLKPEDAQPWFDTIDHALNEISDATSVKYTTHESEIGYQFVEGNYDRYQAPLRSGAESDAEGEGIRLLQLQSYDSIRQGLNWGIGRDQAHAEGLVAPGISGIQERTDSVRAVARIQRDKPRLHEVREGQAQIAGVARQYAQDLKAYDEDDQPLPTPKGPEHPSKLTRDQWIMVRTPNFLRWGGDWLHDPKNAAVLLDKYTGEPQVFYHETDPRNEASILVQGFRTDLPGSRFNDASVPEGTFFKPQRSGIGVGGTGKEFRLQMPTFLRMRKPLEVANKDEIISTLGGDIAKQNDLLEASIHEKQVEFNKAAQYAEDHPDEPNIFRTVEQLGNRMEDSFEPVSEKAQIAIRSELKAQGYDGVIIKHDEGRNNKVTQTYIVLDSNDAKSAAFNVGTFSERAAPMYRKGALPEAGKRVEDVKAATDALVNQFKTKPEVVVHANRADATPEAKEALDDTVGPDVTPQAMYLDGKLHVFADANTSPAMLEKSVLHEMVHFGLRHVFGDSMDPLLDDIWQNAKNDKSFNAILHQYRGAYKGRPDFQRNIAEEYIAHLAENRGNPGLWRKVVDWFRAWARSHGLVHDWTDDDIRHLIGSVYADLKAGRTSVAGIPTSRTTVDFQSGLQRTAYRGAAHGDFIQDSSGDWRFENPDVTADLSRSLVDGEKALNAEPAGKLTAQGVKDLAALAGEERAVLTLPDSVPRKTLEAAAIPFGTHDGMHVLRPEASQSPMYALRNRAQADPDTQAIIDHKIGYEHAPTSPWEWLQAPLRAFHFRALLNEAKAYWLDAGAYLDLMERKLNKGLLFDAVTSAYKQYWLSRNIRQIAMAVIHRGVPMWTPKGYDFRPDTKGLMEIWKPLMQTADGKNLMDLYGAYKIGIRAKRLLHEFNPDGSPKEKLLTEDEADKFIALAKKYPVFKTAFAEEQKFINQLLDFAVERGALDGQTAQAWKRNAYVPFRRIIDGIDTPSDFEQRGVSDKIKSKRLRGAAYALKDPNQSLINNTIRILDHIYNNDAKRRVMAIGELAGAVKRVPLKWIPETVSVQEAMRAMRDAGIEVDRTELTPEDLQKLMTVFRPMAPRGRGIESTVENGKLVWWQVNDARLLKSIHDMRAINSAMTDAVIKYAGAPARWVRWGVTMSPKFMVKIMFKDAANTWAQTGTNPNMLKHVWTNAAHILTNDRFIDQLRLNGFNGNEYYKVDDIGNYVKQVGGRNGNMVLSAIDKTYHAYRRTGWISEQLSRTRVAEHILDRGGSMAEAAWQGQNTLNWQKHGYGTAAKILMRLVPFLNAHLQGMVRIYDGSVGRDVLTNRNRAIMSFFIKSMAVAIPSMVLEAENQNNKDYQRLPDYMKDAYWNIYIGGHHYMLPKPFEWGAVAGTMPQRALRVATGQDSSREFWKSVYDTLTNDVLTLPIPAIAQEPLEQFANKDFRTGLPIETEAEQNRQPADRFNRNTTLAAKELGRVTNQSPVRIQHFVNGYFSSVGMYALQAMSALMRTTGHYPTAPAPRGGSWVKEMLESPFGGGMAATETGSQYLSDFYDAQAEADRVAGSVHDKVTRGEYGRAQQLAEDNPLAFRGHHELQVISVRLRELRKQQRVVEASPYLNAQQKRAQLDAINDAQKQLLDRYEPFFRAVLDGKKQIETEQ